MSSYSKALVESAMSLVTDQVKSAFLGAEVKEKSEEEVSLDSAWKHLGRGELAAAIEACDQILQRDQHNEKLYFTRAYAHCRAGEWQRAMADYSRYLKINEAPSGPTLANAYYGRALCLAKLGNKAAALRDLNECIKIGPVDEQLCDRGEVSLVPRAKAAKMLLTQAFPELAGAQERAAAEAAAARAAASSEAAEESAASDEPVYEGKVWRVPITALESALARVRGAGKTALLLDRTPEKVTDNYFMYAEATVVEAKKLVLEVRSAGVPVEAAREAIREQLVHAMRWGHTLVVRMANTAADFTGTYCAPDAFPPEVFDCAKLPSGNDAAKDATFSKVLRSGHALPVPPQFGVVVTSTFAVDSYEALLGPALPMANLQAMDVFMPSEAARSKALRAEGAKNSGPLSGVLHGVAARTTGDAPKAGQLQGDRATLFLSN